MSHPELAGMSLADFVVMLDRQKQLGLSEKDVNQSVKTLEDQWFNTASELAALDSEAFSFVSLPRGLSKAIIDYFKKGDSGGASSDSDSDDPEPEPIPADDDFARILQPRKGSKDLNDVVSQIMQQCSENEFVMAGLQSLLKKSIKETGSNTMKKNALAATLKKVNKEQERSGRGSISVDFDEEEKGPPDAAPTPLSPRQLAEYSGAPPCGICKGRRDKPLELDCRHTYDKICLHDYIMDHIAKKSAVGLKCPDASCGSEMNVTHIQNTLSVEEFNQYLEATLMAFIEQDNLTFVCPNNKCMAAISIQPYKPQPVPSPMTERDADGKILTPEAWLHFQEFRVRCRQCSTVFCANCKTVPYHKGSTCDQYQEYQKARHCRFCGNKLTASNSAKDPPGPGLRDVCTEKDCMEKRTNCCSRIKVCGCPCNGVHDEDEKDCLPCLKHDLDVDENEFCSVCYVESLKDAPCIQVGNGCEHVFHYHCSKNKLQASWPGARISFEFVNCPLCQKSMEFHPAFNEIIKPIQDLKDKVEEMALERLKYEGRENDPAIVSPSGRFYDDPLGFAMHQYLFYMCHQCKKPYFAGGYQCQEANAPFNPEELVCPSCQPGSYDECPKHGKDWLAYKCRYCCSFANWYCWGRTHFCGECHKSGVWQKLCEFRTGKNKKRMWEYNQCAGMKEKMAPILADRSLSDDEKEKKMEALTADPAMCDLHVSHPPNGMEFGLGCSMCEDKKDESRNREAAQKALEELEEKKKAFEAVRELLRQHPGGYPLKFQKDNDENGLMWFLATCGKTAKWSNPCDNGFVQCSSSGMMGDSTPLSMICARETVRCVTKPIRNSWIQWDLIDLAIEPTHYSIRHYSSWDTECLRNWVMEGSNDGLSWTTLMHHRDDKALNAKGQVYTWPIRSGGKRYRMFRMVQTAVNSNNHYYLSCSGVEMYGLLFDSIPNEEKDEEEDDEKIPVKTFNYTYDMDTNGILYYLGMDCGRSQQWKNPALIGQVIVTSSELAAKPPSMPAYAICGRTLCRCVSMARPNMWFALDLKDKRCRVTHYTIKHYNSWDTEALRNWKFEGSNDGVHWTILRNHLNDEGLNGKGSTHTWTIETDAYYSMFRIFQTGKNSNNHYYLACSGMELYGDLKSSPPLRVPKGGVQMTYSYDFDCNGVFYWLGTRGKRQPWRNPAQAGLVTCTASSLASNPPSHPPSAIVGRTLVRCVTSASPNQWFMVDLKDKAVQLSHYTIRHYNSWDTEALRSWLLEGSNDGFKWLTLKEHKNDWALDKKGATYTWPVTAGNMRFRMLRIRQTGLNSNNHHYLSCSGMEIYGALFNANQPDLSAIVGLPSGMPSPNLGGAAPPSYPGALSLAPGGVPGAGVGEMKGDQLTVQFADGMEFVYSHDLDENGIVFWLGTEGRSKPYRNPAMGGLLKVTSSPLASQSMPAWAACGRDIVRCVTEPKKHTWFCFDFGSIFIIPTAYTLRHYDSWDTEALRNWKLEGSVDGKKWKTLMTHKKDKALDKKGATHTWPIKGISKSYSMYKITQTGKNSNKHWYLSLSGFEIYGKIYNFRKK